MRAMEVADCKYTQQVTLFPSCGNTTTSLVLGMGPAISLWEKLEVKRKSQAENSFSKIPLPVAE